MTKKQILKLRPEFKFGGMRMMDWFEIIEGGGYITIKNGLRHADGETKSPFFYEDFCESKKEKQLIEKFNNWWNSLSENKLNN